jgi:FkbM family methyltransferase
MVLPSLQTALFKLIPAPLEKYLRRQRYYLVARDRRVPDAELCRPFLKSGDMVIDVGANIGLYSRVFSAYVGAQGSVHALEPIPETFGYLSYNVERLGLKNVFLHNVAAAATSGNSRMSVPTMRAGFTNIYEAQLNDAGEIPVQTRRLDDLFAGSKPAFIKIDVEGYEAEVIRGAERLLRMCHPALLIEASSPEAERLLRPLGYRRREIGTVCDQFFAYEPSAAGDPG